MFSHSFCPHWRETRLKTARIIQIFHSTELKCSAAAYQSLLRPAVRVVIPARLRKHTASWWIEVLRMDLCQLLNWPKDHTKPTTYCTVQYNEAEMVEVARIDRTKLLQESEVARTPLKLKVMTGKLLSNVHPKISKIIDNAEEGLRGYCARNLKYAGWKNPKAILFIWEVIHQRNVGHKVSENLENSWVFYIDLRKKKNNRMCNNRYTHILRLSSKLTIYCLIIYELSILFPSFYEIHFRFVFFSSLLYFNVAGA